MTESAGIPTEEKYDYSPGLDRSLLPENQVFIVYAPMEKELLLYLGCFITISNTVTSSEKPYLLLVNFSYLALSSCHMSLLSASR